MSVIQKIRTKYAKLAGGVIAFALVAFILTDFLTGNNGGLFGRDDSAVKVNGDKIDFIEYNTRVQAYETLYGASQELDENMRAQLREQALQDLIKEKLIREEAEKIGLTVTKKEENEMIYGQDPDQAVKTYQAFTNPETNRFDPQRVKLFEQQIDQIDPSGRAKAHWEEMKKYVVYNALPKKYNMLFNNSVYVPKYLIEARLEREEQMANIDFVSIPYDGNDKVELTDEDYKDYVNKHKKEYTIQVASRSIEYVPFNLLPSKEDTARALDALVAVKDDFTDTKDNESFVNRNSDVSYRENYVKKATFLSPYSDSLFGLKEGEVYGPYFERDNYKLTKLVDVKQYPDSVKCRHILVKTADRGREILSDSLAKLKIDSAIAALKAGATFAEVVQKYSEDDGSKNTAGEYTFAFQQRPNLSKEFGDFIFENRKGDKETVKVENSNYSGYHYIEILNQPGLSNAYSFATIEKALYPGENTENNVFAQASEFAASHSTAAAFDSAGKSGLVQRRFAENIKVNDFSIQGLGSSNEIRQIIQWLYNSEVGAISQVFSLSDKYVVIKNAGKKEKGLMPLDDNLKANIESDVRNKKLADQTIQKYNDKSTLAAVSEASGQEIKKADSFRANSSFTGDLGFAPKVVGYTFSKSTQLNTMSPAIQGQGSIYYVVPTAVFQDPYRNTDSALISREQVMMQSQIKNAMSGTITEQLIKNADVDYNVDNL